MKAIILAAGRGTRMGTLTSELPKAMLSVSGRTLLERQLQCLRKCSIQDISVITGFQKEKISYDGIKKYHNEEYASTNMIESLMCASEELNDDVLICYGDIIYTHDLATKMIESQADIGVAVDDNWRTYWKQRYGTTEHDLESLLVSGNGLIEELGQPLDSSEGVDFRYIGLIKFSKAGLIKALELYAKKKSSSEGWTQSGNDFRNGYMTDFLHELIEAGNGVTAIPHSGGWLEFDTAEDHEVGVKLMGDSQFSQDFN